MSIAIRSHDAVTYQKEIRNRRGDKVLFTADLDIKLATAPEGTQVWEAFKQSLAAGLSLEGANLRGMTAPNATLEYLSLRGCDFTGADLSGADLGNTNLRSACLRNVDLRGALLGFTDLQNADLRGADLRRAGFFFTTLCNAKIKGADLGGILARIPVIKDIHQTVYASARKPNALCMSYWHRSETTHCRGGWVIRLAGEAGDNVESWLGPRTAAALIYLNSDPTLERIPDFFTHRAKALRQMKRCAEREAA
jgi:hypothetical protein